MGRMKFGTGYIKEVLSGRRADRPLMEMEDDEEDEFFSPENFCSIVEGDDREPDQEALNEMMAMQGMGVMGVGQANDVTDTDTIVRERSGVETDDYGLVAAIRRRKAAKDRGFGTSRKRIRLRKRSY